MKLVDCDPKYWNFVKEIRTNPENQTGFFSLANISDSEQKEFMSKNHQNYNICISVEGDLLGYVGIINHNEITYCVHPDHKNKGVGTFMVENFVKKYNEVSALVKPENVASQKVFEKLNWDKKILYTKK
jgi:RimJ/RimL family protein N-acetyltransferase